MPSIEANAFLAFSSTYFLYSGVIKVPKGKLAKFLATLIPKKFKLILYL